jgi:hypothetical protein
MCTGRSILELQQPTHYRGRRNRLDSRRSISTSTQAVLRETLRFPRQHICLELWLENNNWKQFQAGEFVSNGQFSQ